MLSLGSFKTGAILLVRSGTPGFLCIFLIVFYSASDCLSHHLCCSSFISVFVITALTISLVFLGLYISNIWPYIFLIFGPCALQAGLFVYDIFWVFFTPVMVSVAKSFDAPIKVCTPD